MRHGHARPAGGVRTDLGLQSAVVLAESNARASGAIAGFLFHCRGLLGPGMDAAATGVRLRLWQAALRPPARRVCAGGARAFTSGPRLTEQARPVPGKP